MANVANPHKKFQWSIQLLGRNPFLSQKVTIPEMEVQQTPHGEENTDIKTAGRVVVGNCNIENIEEAAQRGGYWWDWISLCQDSFIGGGAVSEVYKQEVIVEKYSTDGRSVVGRWLMTGCWPTKINGVELERVSSDNTITSIELSVDKMKYL